MSQPTKITVIGAGSASFGENTLSAIMHSKNLRGSTLALVDRNADSLDIVHRLANRLNREWDAHFTITSHTDHEDALPDSKFVVNAIEVGARENLWRKDFEIPLQYGVRQPYAENGGPGGFAHAARNIGPIMQIAQDMEKACPDAWFVNFTNPMVRICDAVNRHSTIKAVGLCHQIYAGYIMVGVALARDLGIEVPDELSGLHAAVDQFAAQYRVRQQIVPLVDIRAAGLNHFTWILSIHDRRTGEDLYPLGHILFQVLEELIADDPLDVIGNDVVLFGHGKPFSVHRQQTVRLQTEHRQQLSDHQIADSITGLRLSVCCLLPVACSLLSVV